jgi:hypothetical protein
MIFSIEMGGENEEQRQKGQANPSICYEEWDDSFHGCWSHFKMNIFRINKPAKTWCE